MPKTHRRTHRKICQGHHRKRRRIKFDPTVIEKALKGLQMPMLINDTDAPVTQFCSESFNRISAVGCRQFRTKNPEQTVNLMMQYVCPFKLKNRFKSVLNSTSSYERMLRNSLQGFQQKPPDAYNTLPTRIPKRQGRPETVLECLQEKKTRNHSACEKLTVTRSSDTIFRNVGIVQKKKKALWGTLQQQKGIQQNKTH